MVDGLIEIKQKFVQELHRMDRLTEQFKEILTPWQNAKFLVVTERVSSSQFNSEV
jgi:hypothetical protein